MPENILQETTPKYNLSYSKLSSNLTGAPYLQSFVTSGRKGTGTAFENTSIATDDRIKSLPSKPAINNGEKIKYQYYFKGCLEALEKATTNFDDIFSRANAISNLNKNLALLWGYRKYREESYARLINKVQTLLLEVKPEEITLAQLNALVEILQDVSNKQVITKLEFKEYLKIFSHAGYDIFRALR